MLPSSAGILIGGGVIQPLYVIVLWDAVTPTSELVQQQMCLIGPEFYNRATAPSMIKLRKVLGLIVVSLHSDGINGGGSDVRLPGSRSTSCQKYCYRST